jgi:uncharacterized RDD family membrane protein YckC
MQMVVGGVIAYAYFIGLESSAWKATIGKRLMKIYVAREDGSRASPLRIFGRFILLRFPSYPLMVLDYLPAYRNGFFKQIEATKDPDTINSLLLSPLGKEYFIFLGGTIVANIILYCAPIIFTKQKTGLHDYFSHTRVLRKPTA